MCSHLMSVLLTTSMLSQVALTSIASSVEGPIPLENALTCPISQPEAIGVPTKHSSVRIGVVVLVIDSQGNVLITRRAKHMRTFPRAWVFPGGERYIDI